MAQYNAILPSLGYNIPSWWDECSKSVLQWMFEVMPMHCGSIRVLLLTVWWTNGIESKEEQTYLMQMWIGYSPTVIRKQLSIDKMSLYLFWVYIWLSPVIGKGTNQQANIVRKQVNL